MNDQQKKEQYSGYKEIKEIRAAAGSALGGIRCPAILKTEPPHLSRGRCAGIPSVRRANPRAT